MRRLAATLGVAALLATGGSAAKPARQAHPAKANLCTGGERVVYSCQFGTRLGSVCLGRASIHYRFGKPGRLGLNLGSAPDWGNVHTHQLYSKAFAQNHIRMTRGTISYIVHFGEAGSLSDVPGKTISGLVVVDGPSKTLADMSCKGGAQIDTEAFLDIPRKAPPHWDGSEIPDGPFDAYF